MNILIVVLNRVYLLLTKVKNQSPLFGAVTLVTILISFTTLNLIGFYSIKIAPITINIPQFLCFNLLVFIPLFFYAKRNKGLITEGIVSSPKRTNLIVALVYLFTIVSTIYLANINRDKISKQTKQESVEPHKESLEGKIRKWFE